MKEHPVLFSTDMVKAILDGTKTQTRRVIKPQFVLPDTAGKPYLDGNGYLSVIKDKGNFSGWYWITAGATNHKVSCPYGQVGDRLWVRETHTWVTLAEKDPWKDRAIADGSFRRDYNGEPVTMIYKADGYEIGAPWRPSIHMPRWASRIEKIITLLRAEQLRDISKEDAQAEGGYTIKEFITLYLKINHLSADANPWNWVIGW